jgi:predicted nucleic-acid-binding Zn-ribbon protein
MKRTWQCPKCQSARVGYLETLPDGARGEASRPRMFGEAVLGSVFGAVATQVTAPIEAFVCTECGYFEEYVKDPASINWANLVGFRWCQRSGPSGT